MAKLVKRFDEEVDDYGDVIHAGEVSNLGATAVTPGNDVTPAAPTEDEKTITVNRHFESSYEIHDRTKWQAKLRLSEEYRSKAGYAIAKQIDTDLLGEYADADNSVGDGSTAVTDANIIAAIRLLDIADVPLEDRYFVIHPDGIADIRAIDKFIRADAVGYNPDGSPILKGEFGQIYGVRVLVSNNVIIAAGTPTVVHNLLFHKDAVGLAMQKEIQWEQNRGPKSLSDIYIAQALWGYNTLRTDHIIDYRSAE
jgi:N4-gp56 family major capsid protein